jgi:hypothetical protein
MIPYFVSESGDALAYTVLWRNGSLQDEVDGEEDCVRPTGEL